MADLVQYDLREGVARLSLDDGKANAISHAMLDAVNGALDRAEKEAGAVLIAGRPGRFSAGFDLSVMRSGGAAVGELVGGGARLALRLYEFPSPVVAACTGHALAMGAILLLASDTRLGARGDFKLGLNEVAIGMTGSRMTGLLLRQLKREGKRYGIVTMCVGGDQGFASLFEAA